jgi:dTDP-4-amino-4,6-dideoxygalactose transaminase
MNKPITVTRPTLPPFEEFIESLRAIWDSRILTNNGPFHEKFEKDLAAHLGVEHLSLFANGTLALLAALRIMDLDGEVITTPFSFVATTHALWWNGLRPVFADIEPDFFNLDPERVEAAITPRTRAILPVHVYGQPCRVERFRDIAAKHGLRLIYDAAHAFGVRIGGVPIVAYGDLSVLSFHATKKFNTIEGGAVVCRNAATKRELDHFRNFGYIGETEVAGPGINAKMNELQAAYGLLQLKAAGSIMARCRMVGDLYRSRLRDIPGLRVPAEQSNVEGPPSYFPILIETERFGRTRDDVYESLKKNRIFGRRYFYPLISRFPPYNGLPSAAPANLPVAERAASQVLCLPLYPDLEPDDVNRICDIIAP